ncbi:MAG: HEAT repeat domain-containing protein [Vicinamibacterales bacterium]
MSHRRWLHRARKAALVFAAGIGVGCASTPTRTPPVAVPTVAPLSLDQKVSWILRLEQQRILRDPDAGPEGPDVADAGAVPELRQARRADLEALARDSEDVVRQRAALAIGRVGRLEGLPALLRSLHDSSSDVRASAAFAVGLIGDKSGAAALEPLLADASPLVRTRAIDALGLLAQPGSAAAIAQVAAGCAALIAPIAPDDEEWPKSPEIELCRSSLFALVRLGSFDALASVALDAAGAPVSRWWPVAFALQRNADARALPALRALVSSAGIYTPTFALRGLGTLKDATAIPLAREIAARRDADIKVRAAAIRTLGQIGGPAAVPSLAALLSDAALPSNLAIETATALGNVRDRSAFDPLVDLITDRIPAVRAAAIAAMAKADPEGFLLILAGLDRDPDWTVRAALAAALEGLPLDRVRPALLELVADEDLRVRGPALEALAAAKDPGVVPLLMSALGVPDFAVRATAAQLLGTLKAAGGVDALVAAYTRAETDTAFTARAAALEGLSRYGGEAAIAVLKRALSDPEWPVRWRAAELLRGLGESAELPGTAAPIHQPLDVFDSKAVLHPDYSPHAFIETRYGTVEVQLDVVNATMTTRAFVEMARSGLFNGLKAHRVIAGFVVQAGDPRGDGEGGPGYTVRDELSVMPYLRGTMGLALNWRDTGGSQWFITLAPQPHLDDKYTVFGRVVNGWDVLDRITPGDVIERVRIWDGATLE